MQPRVTDDDMGGIDVTLNGEILRGWYYNSDDERRVKMLCAREYVEGWCDGRASHSQQESTDAVSSPSGSSK